MKTIHASALLLALTGASWAFNVGSTRDEVAAELGRPTAEMKKGGKEFMYYGGGAVVLVSGKVASADGQIAQYLTMKKQGLAFEGGKWISQEEKKRQAAERVEQGKIGPKVKVIANGGKKVDLATLLVPGKITVIDFYADWCGPCRRMAPYLEDLTAQPDLYLRKVDIVNWESEVSKQYDLHEIPNVRVYDAKGKMIGKPTYDPDKVWEYIEKARL